MKAAFYTLGCKVNQYETQEIISLLKNEGYEIISHKGKADIYIINSCTVTAESSRKTRQAVRRFRNDNPHSVIILTGCFPQAFTEEATALSEADIILGNNANHNIIEAINEFNLNKKQTVKVVAHKREDKYKGIEINTFDGHTRAFIKIQDGCNRYCSYCIIPKARGFSRSRPLEAIRKEIERLAKAGYKEIVFVGINLSAYGLDTNGNICDALQIAEETEGIERIRLGSLEPDHITDEVIKRLAGMKKFCPQFHLSLQSGSNPVLKRMNRHYTAEEYSELCSKLKRTFSDISLTTDIIVGFPGETEEYFRETLEFAKKCGFMKVHVFPFSPREGTVAYKFTDKIPNAVKAERCSLLQKECDKIREAFLREAIGKTVNVLFETPKGNIQQGYTENYTPVTVPYEENLCGQIRKVKILSCKNDTCTGTLE